MGNVIQADLSLKKDEKGLNSSQENIKRSIVKTISWRAVGTIATVTISYIITGTMALAFSIGGIELVSKMVLYFFHERAWNNIKWGK
ncbi:DUF2061 domain-containing protein [Winogradskyella echinorum]|uniref:DUF2061 domain-containing protein n=1 Tax=Winogradskyella echinorum TaxID=538189 RepID=A0ABR6Y3X8_9FLAO|nr:DUF2061 domain-containing protein [Winogradskyella echinorum]MBC3847449.1 DUF2061 domain-containing protein [Winogradskyella echinorum]MBC5751797.1 DUF2061 domain-containing protein [Winogradskyella echinorum]